MKSTIFFYSFLGKVVNYQEAQFSDIKDVHVININIESLSIAFYLTCDIRIHTKMHTGESHID